MLVRPTLVLVALVGFLGLTGSSVAAAQSSSENAEARVYFEEGNRLYEQANRVGGAQRASLLQRSLEAYVDSLRIVRSRNALFNAAMVLGELERRDESFNYLSEYLHIEGLPASDREDATRRRERLRSQVAVLQVSTEPSGARLWIDRRDLAPRGETPIELALPPGEHHVFIEREGYLTVERTQSLVLGRTIVLQLPLTPVPVEPVPPTPEPDTSTEEPPRPRLRNAAMGTAAATLASAGVALGVSIRARALRNDYDDAAEAYRMSGDPADFQRAQDLADRTDRFNLAADVLWGTTIALGVSAIVLYGVHRKRHRKAAPEIGVSVSRHGGFASVRMPLGVAR